MHVRVFVLLLVAETSKETALYSNPESYQPKSNTPDQEPFDKRYVISLFHSMVQYRRYRVNPEIITSNYFRSELNSEES